MKDLVSNCKKAIAIAPASYAADTTPVAVDLAGYLSAMLEIDIGVGGITFDASNKIEFKLTHSDDNATYTAVAAVDVQLPAGATLGDGGLVKSLTAAHAAASITKIGYIGGKRYVKLLADFTGTHGTATPITATWTLGHPLLAPVA